MLDAIQNWEYSIKRYIVRNLAVPNVAVNQEQTFLLELLRATYQNQEVYPILQQNLNKLNDKLALILRKWVSVDA